MKYIPARFLPPLNGLPAETRSRLTEVRFRLNKPLSLTVNGKNLLLGADGKPCAAGHALRATQADLDELLERMTGGSLYAFEEQIANGFLPLENGCRAGVAGEALTVASGAWRFRSITSVNLRIPRFLPEFARPLMTALSTRGATGVLILSPPAGGKTTFLRSIAYLLASEPPYRRVGIADERGELWIPDGLCDRISGCPKEQAIRLLTRSMSPEYLLCDELGAFEEQALLASANTGVCLIATAHAATVGQARLRPCVKHLLEAQVFGLCVLLQPGFRPVITEWPPCD